MAMDGMHDSSRTFFLPGMDLSHSHGVEEIWYTQANYVTNILLLYGLQIEEIILCYLIL